MPLRFSSFLLLFFPGCDGLEPEGSG